MIQLETRGRGVALTLAAVALAATAVALAAPAARAQPAPSVTEQAQHLFEQGLKHLEAGRIAEACAAFDASQRLEPLVTTLLNLADCHERNHQLATAWAEFAQAEQQARSRSNAALEKVANKHATSLRPRLSQLTVSVPADHRVPGLEVRRGSDPVNPASWSRAVPVDGGSYTITARAPGCEPWSTTRAIKPEGDNQTIEVPRLAAVPAPPVATTEPPAASPAPVRGEPAPPRREPVEATGPAAPAGGEPGPAGPGESAGSHGPGAGSSLVLPVAVGVGAVALGGVALYMNARGDDHYAAAQRATMPAVRDREYDAANTSRYAAQVFAGAAIVAAGAAVAVYLRGRADRPATTAMAPLVAPGLAGAALIGRW